MTKKQYLNSPAYSWYTSRCTLLLLLSGQLQTIICWHTHLVVLQTVMFQCYTISLRVSARYAHMMLVPVLGIAEEIVFNDSHIGQW